MVLRHHLTVLKRQVGRPRLRRHDRLLIAALSQILPRPRWSSFVVRRQTLLRWHRELVRRKWTYHGNATGGRPPLAEDVRELILRMARENPRWGACHPGELAKLGIRDRDPKYASGFGGVFASEGLKVILTPVQAPRANAFAEQRVRTVRAECLDWTLVLGRRQLERILRTYVAHYHIQRLRHGLDLRAPDPRRLRPASLPIACVFKGGMCRVG
ncbi:MAG TPA: hypothetical protein VFA45_19685 [Actinomycetes bacterium]|nr:hypothetical protein [Actinomycetes bacterium]